MNRVKPYSEIGRNQNEYQSDEIGIHIRNKLNKLKIKYIILDGDEEAPKLIYNLIKGQ